MNRDDVDAVVVATPNVFHAPVSVAAARGRKHVLVDKPMARTVAEADEMIAAADAGGVWLVPFQNLRFAPVFAAAHDVVASGRIGDIVGFRAAFGHGGPQSWAPRATWFFDPELAGGGCLLDLGVHIIDVVRHVTGDELADVSAVLAGPGHGVERDAHVLARLARGALGTVHASWSSAAGPDQQLTVTGSAATLHVDTRTPLTLVAGDGRRERVALPDSESSPLLELLAAIRGEREPSVRAVDGRAAVAVVDAAYEAARTGRWVTVR